MSNREDSAPKLNRAFVLTKCSYFTDIQLWPINSELNPTAWLSNFEESELDFALAILNGFIFINKHLTEHIFRSGFHALSEDFVAPGKGHRTSKSDWKAFIANSVFTKVSGENPNDTDSGFIFQRMARQVLGVSEQKILSTPTAAETLSQATDLNLIFLDDFVGSGEQFIRTWNNKHMNEHCFTDCLLPGNRFIYCPLISTEYGLKNIKAHCPAVELG